MTDDSEGVEPQEQDGAGDPAVAFDALRRTVEDLAGDLTREMTTIRKGVEAAFEEIEKHERPPNYGPDLGRIVAALAGVEQRLGTIEKSPALRNGPDHYARAIENAGSRASDSAGRTLEARGQALDRAAAELGRHVRSARQRREQDRWVFGAGAVGLVVGVLLTLFAPRALPGSVDMAVAATAMSADRWNAGARLMQSGSPGDWSGLVDASNFVQANREALAACAATAAKAKKDQRCAVIVAAPAQK
jgi:hypothetical protein